MTAPTSTKRFYTIRKTGPSAGLGKKPKAAPSGKTLPNLSLSQESALWPMVADAWRAHARREQLRESDSKAKTAWRKAVLMESCGIASLRLMQRAGGQFPRFMAALQEVARNGVEWILRCHGAETRPLIHRLRALLVEMAIDEDYAQRIARRALKVPEEERTPEWEQLSAAQLCALIRIFHGEGIRIGTFAARRAQETSEEGEPF